MPIMKPVEPKTEHWITLASTDSSRYLCIGCSDSSRLSSLLANCKRSQGGKEKLVVGLLQSD